MTSSDRGPSVSEHASPTSEPFSEKSSGVDQIDSSHPGEVQAPRLGRIKRLGILRRLLILLAPHQRRFWLASVALLLGSAVSLVYPQAARFAVDLGIDGDSSSKLNQIALLLFGLFCIHAILVWIRHYLMSWLGQRVVADLRILVFERVLGLSSSWFHAQRSGELTGRLASDVTVIQGVVGSELSLALRNGVQLIGGMILLFIENAYLTGLMLLVVPPLTFGVVVFGRAIRQMSKAVQDRVAETSAQIQESVSSISTVQAFVREQHELEIYTEGVEAAFDKALSLARWRASFFSVTSFAGYAAIVFIVWMGGREVIAGDLSPGDLTAFMLYTMIVATGLANVASLWGALQKASGAVERLFAIVDRVPAIRDPKNPVPLPKGRGAIEFDQVCFDYPSRPDKPVLRDVTFSVRPGEAVAVVGPSGAGKTTLTALLYRFFDVKSGVVRLDGVDVRQLELAQLRRAMSVVAQEPSLFSGTIAANIAYGRDDASQEEIEEAAAQSNAHDFIMAFPEGYQTLCGERGVKLSGGQKQRIAIARALIADPRVLILDEATSNLDAESESEVQTALAAVMRERTTMVIAHRLSTIRNADRILVFEDGRVVESGDHDTLRAQAGLYARLVDKQLH